MLGAINKGENGLQLVFQDDKVLTMASGHKLETALTQVLNGEEPKTIWVDAIVEFVAMQRWSNTMNIELKFIQPARRRLKFSKLARTF